MYLAVPESFDGLSIDGSAGISAQSLRLPLPEVISKIMQVAGGMMLDLDYGYDADLLPSPFTVSFYFEGSTPAILRSRVESLLDAPGTGKLGSTGYFVVTLHGSSTEYRCTAQMQKPNFNISGNTFGPNTTRLAGILVPFKPVDLFTVVV